MKKFNLVNLKELLKESEQYVKDFTKANKLLESVYFDLGFEKELKELRVLNKIAKEIIERVELMDKCFEENKRRLENLEKKLKSNKLLKNKS